MTIAETMELSTIDDSGLCGARFGRLCDLAAPRYFELLAELERYSDGYLRQAHECGKWPVDYPWPTDSLHCNTRLWEYPFVVDSIRRFTSAGARLLDIGSALTFFPSFMAAQGCAVTASDFDVRMPQWFAAIAEGSRFESPEVLRRLTYRQSDVTALEFDDDSFDIVTNVSVLEHLSCELLHKAVVGIRRVLRSDGLFVCTLDCRLSGIGTPEHHPLDDAEFADFLDVLFEHFEPVERSSYQIPSGLITNRRFPRALAARGFTPGDRGPLPPLADRNIVRRDTLPGQSPLRRLKHAVKSVLGMPAAEVFEWCVFGIALRRR
jgi:SAM-dependent methyltransferase